MYDDLIRELELCPDAEYGCSRCEHRVSLHCRESLMKQAADAIEELQQQIIVTKKCYQMMAEAYEAEVTKPKWISVEERLPDDHVRVLFCNDEGKMVTGERAEDDWWYCYCAYDVDRWDEKEQGRVVAWQPLPEPPKEGDD